MKICTILIYINILSLTSAFSQYVLEPHKLEFQGFEQNAKYYPHVSPTGEHIVFSMTDKKGAWQTEKYYWAKRTDVGWSYPLQISILKNSVTGKSVFNWIWGFNGEKLFFTRRDELKKGVRLALFESEFRNSRFDIALLVQFDEPEDLPFGMVSKIGNPHRFFKLTSHEHKSDQEVYEVYYVGNQIQHFKQLPDHIVGLGIENIVAAGSNGLFFNKIKGSETYLAIKFNDSWTLPVVLDFKGFEKEKIQVESYSEVTKEIFFYHDATLYSTKIPGELSDRISTDYDIIESVNLQLSAERSTNIEKPIETKYYALLIAIEDYQNDQTGLNDLSNPWNDAINLKSVLVKNYSFEEQNITILKDPERADIINSFEQLSSLITEKDNLLIFYAGHGIWDEKLNVGYWLSSDATTQSKSNWISNSTVRDYIAGLNTKHTLLISDACFSGSIFRTREITKSIDDYGYYRLNKLPSRKAMTSGTLGTVPDDSKFMKYLLKALEENDKEYLPSKQLFHEIEIAIINNTANIPQFGTIQNTGDEGGDFIFIKKEKEE